MKNMKKLLQKAMVFTLSAAMLVGTPMTASAAGLVDLYSVSDGTSEDPLPGKGDVSAPTGTVTNTDTNTGALIGENVANIVGIALDRETVNAEVGTSETLRATVVLDRDLGEDTDAVVKELSKKIKWQVLYLDADGNPAGDSKANPANKVAIEGTADNRSEITLNPQHGTAPDEKVTVRATVDASYYFKGNETAADAKQSGDDWANKYIVQDEARKGAVYTVDATVTVKEYSTGLAWKDGKTADTMQLKHTLDLGAQLARTPETANDAITWVSSNPGAAAVSATGVVTAKKVTTADVKITAVSEHGVKLERAIKIEQGMKASRVAITESWSENSLEIVGGDRTITVETYAKVTVAKDTDGNLMIADASNKLDASKKGTAVQRNAEVKNGDWYVDADGKVQQMVVTDVITWSSNKTAFATVTPVGDQKGGGTAKVSPKAVGKATITAKATNGAKASKVANVLATLTKLEIKGVTDGQTVYSGQTIQLIADRTPAQNKDAVKWTVTKEDGTTRTTNATINAKGILTIKNQVADGEKIKVTLAHNKRGTTVPVATVTLTVKQSSIDGITVVDNTTKAVIAQAALENNRIVQKKRGTENTSYINVPLNKTYTATVDVAAGGLANDVALSTLTWKSNKPKVAELTGSGASAKIKAVGPGKATITVSGVRVVNNRASVIKTTFTVQVKQPVKTLVMNKPTVTLAQKTHARRGTLDQKVALKVTFGPKNADRSQKVIDSWTVQNVKTGAKWTVTTGTGAREKKVTAASVSVNLTQPEAGDVYKITAKSITGATATSTVTIVAPTKAVAIAEGLKADGTLTAYPRTGASIKIGDQPLQLNSYINITNSRVTENGWMLVGSDAAKTVKAEDVTYTVNKKGIVTVDKNGKVYAVKKGVVTITAKTPTGKKATLKVTVSEPSAQ